LYTFDGFVSFLRNIALGPRHWLTLQISILETDFVHASPFLTDRNAPGEVLITVGWRESAELPFFASRQGIPWGFDPPHPPKMRPAPGAR